jgi:hypothetical protein
VTFELGVNYWPRRRAMCMWREFDLGEIRAIQRAPITPALDITADEYYAAPARHFERLYACWLSTDHA